MEALTQTTTLLFWASHLLLHDTKYASFSRHKLYKLTSSYARENSLQNYLLPVCNPDCD